MHSLDFRIVIIKKGDIVEAMSSKVILMIPKNQELSKVSRKDSRIKFQDSRIIKIKIQDPRFKNQEKTQSR